MRKYHDGHTFFFVSLQEMPAGVYMGAPLAAAVAAGNVTIAKVNDSVLRILTPMFAMGQVRSDRVLVYWCVFLFYFGSTMLCWIQCRYRVVIFFYFL
jgi:hypothetical protein